MTVEDIEHQVSPDASAIEMLNGLKSLPEGNTSIIIRKATRDTLSECKHGKDTYDSVINRLIIFYYKITGSKIVE